MYSINIICDGYLKPMSGKMFKIFIYLRKVRLWFLTTLYYKPFIGLIHMKVNTTDENVLLNLLQGINRKLDELTGLKEDIATLVKKIDFVEEMLVEEMTENENIELAEAMEEYKRGDTTLLAEAKRSLGICIAIV